MIVLFVGWLAILRLPRSFRFHCSRNPKADYVAEEPCVNYIEGAVAIVEGVLLIGVAIPLGPKRLISFRIRHQSTVLQIVAQQFAWNVRLPGKERVWPEDMTLVSEANVLESIRMTPKGKDDAIGLE